MISTMEYAYKLPMTMTSIAFSLVLARKYQHMDATPSSRQHIGPHWVCRSGPFWPLPLTPRYCRYFTNQPAIGHG